jgi:hypothetical protein
LIGPSELTLVGLPIPSVAILADYMRLVGRTAFTVQTDFSFTSGYTALQKDQLNGAVYLRASISEIVSLIRPQSKEGRETTNLLVAQHYDNILRPLPSITLEQALITDSFVPRFLANRFGLEIRPDTQQRLSEQFSKFRAAGLIWCDPLLWLGKAELDQPSFPTIYSSDLDYSFGVGGAGTAALIHGWHAQERWGVWSRGFCSTLRIRTDRRPAKLIFDCSKIRSELKYSVLVDLNEVQVNVKSTDSSDILTVEIPNDGEFLPSREIRVQFIVANPMSPKDLKINEDTRSIGLGIRCVRIEPINNVVAASQLQVDRKTNLEDRLIKRGFRWLDVPPVDNEYVSKVDVRSVLSQLSKLDWTIGKDILVISVYPGPIETLLRHALPASALVVSVRVKQAARHSHQFAEDATGSRSPEKTDKMLVADGSETGLNHMLSGTFDAVWLVDVEGSEDLVSALNLACLLVAPDGVVIGSERSRISNRAVMRRLADKQYERNLVVLIHNTFWQGRPIANGPF